MSAPEVAPVSYNCRKITFQRCINAMMLTVGSQYLLLTVFTVLFNFQILHPITWIVQSLRTIRSVRVWQSNLPICLAVAIYGLLLAKSLVTPKRYYTSRIRMALGTSLRKLAFLILHLLLGFLTAWTYTSFLNNDYSNFISTCFVTEKCINHRYTYLLFANLSIYCYYFYKDVLYGQQDLILPIIQEAKLVQLRAFFYTTLYKSFKNSFLRILTFSAIYIVLSTWLNRRLANIFGVGTSDNIIFETLDSYLRLFLYSWIMAAHADCNLNLIRKIYTIFLTEQINFAVEKNGISEPSTVGVTLAEALFTKQLPVMQKLAAFDFFTSAIDKKSNKREEIFDLSVPGGHPTNWRLLSGQCLDIIDDFTRKLTISLKQNTNTRAAPLYEAIKSYPVGITAERLLLQQYNKIQGIRSLTCDEVVPPKELPKNWWQIGNPFDYLYKKMRNAILQLPLMSYMFVEQDGAYTAFLLSDSETIMWLTQALAAICAASVNEDKYGVVQDVLPVIIKTLLKLKLELDKLNTVTLISHKVDRNFIVLKNAVKRSLYKICSVFDDYIREFFGDSDDYRYLLCFVHYQET